MDARRVEGAPPFSELIVDFGKEGGRVLAGCFLARAPCPFWVWRCVKRTVTEPDNSSASEATRERLSSNSLSLVLNKFMSLVE